MVAAISSIQGQPQYDYEYMQILAKLRKYGIAPTGNKQADYNTLNKVEKLIKTPDSKCAQGNVVEFKSSMHHESGVEQNKIAMAQQANFNPPADIVKATQDMKGAQNLAELRKWELGIA